MDKDFRGKTVCILPASVDAARASAKAFAEQGADLFLVDGSEQILDMLTEELEGIGAQVRSFCVDPSDADGLERAAHALRDWRTELHALVVCHLDVEAVSLEQASAASWRRAVDQNLLGPVFATKAFLPYLKQASGAAVVYVSSFDGVFGNAFLPLISTVKGAIAPLTHVAANEFSAYGIRVNTVARGMTATPDQDGNPRFAPLIADTPLGRPARPHEIADAVHFLASSRASYISGTVLVVDGGRTAITPGTRRMDVSGSSPMGSTAPLK